MKVRFIKVYWETDGENPDLPEYVEVPASIEKDEIADWLSNKYGWLVSGISFPQIMNITN